MHYVSTRNPDTRLSAAQAIVQGLSRDGGLFLPEEIPQISLEDIKALSLLPYPARAAKLMKLYLDEFTEEELLRFAEKAYGAAKFDDPKAARRKPLYPGAVARSDVRVQGHGAADAPVSSHGKPAENRRTQKGLHSRRNLRRHRQGSARGFP